MTYAKGTDVSVSKSQEEITKIFIRYGVEHYGFAARPGWAAVNFEVKDVPISIAIPLPHMPTEEKIRNPKSGYMVNALPLWEQEVKESWRALVLLLKANLEAVDRGLLSIEQAFLAYISLPNGETLGERVIPQYTEQRLALTAG